MTISIFSASLLLLATLLTSSFCSLMESAYLSLNRILIKKLETSQSIFSRLVLYFTDHFNQFIISILTFNLIANITSTLAANYIFKWFLEEKFGISLLDGNLKTVLLEVLFVVTFTLVILIFSEFVPKKISTFHPKFFAQLGAIPVLIIFLIFYPFVISILKFSKLINQFFTGKKEKNHNKNPIFQEELFGYIQKISKQGGFKKIDTAWLINLLFYMKNPISNIMVTRENIQGLDLSEINGKNIMNMIKKFPYRQIPLYNKNKDDIVAVVSKKDIALKHHSPTINREELLKYSQKPILLPKGKNTLDVLKDIYHSNLDMALTTDEHGGITGIITANDIVTKIFGKVSEEDSDDLNIKQLGEDTFLIKGGILLSDLNHYFKVRLHSQNYETIAGYLLEKMKTIPKRGENYQDEFFIYTIKNRTQKKIISIEMKRKSNDF